MLESGEVFVEGMKFAYQLLRLLGRGAFILASLVLL